MGSKNCALFLKKTNTMHEPMNNFLRQFKEEVRRVSMNTSERATVRASLERAMRDHPVRYVPTVAPLLFVTLRAAPLVLSILLVFGGVAYAAESALPGNMLYAVKLGVNERVREALARSPEAKAAWHVEAAERRAEEAAVLASREALSASIKEELAARLEAHVEKAEALAEGLRAVDEEKAEAIVSRLSFGLEAHSAILARLSRDGEDSESRRESGDLSHRIAARSMRESRADRLTSMAATQIAPASDSVTQTVTLTLQQNKSATAVPDVPLPDTESIRQESSVRSRMAFESSVQKVLTRLEKRVRALRDTLPEERAKELEEQIHDLKGALVYAEADEMRELFRQAIIIEAFLKTQASIAEPILPAPIEIKKGEKRTKNFDVEAD